MNANGFDLPPLRRDLQCEHRLQERCPNTVNIEILFEFDKLFEL